METNGSDEDLYGTAGEEVVPPSVKRWLGKRGLVYLTVYVKDDLFGLFLHVHNTLFFRDVPWVVAEGGLAGTLEHVPARTSVQLLA